MGLFNAVKNTWEKTKVATIIQNLLEIYSSNGLFDGDPSKTATILVSIAWEDSPDIFNGMFDKRPHKYATAAFALVNGLKLYEKGSRNRNVLIMSVNHIFNEVKTNQILYNFTDLDIRIFNNLNDIVTKEMLHYIDKLEEKNLPSSTSEHKSLHENKTVKTNSSTKITVICVNKSCKQKIRLVGNFNSNDKLSVKCPRCNQSFKFIIQL